MVKDLNKLYCTHPALHARDCEPEGFKWIIADDSALSVVAFARYGAENGLPVVTVCNFTPVPRYAYRLGLPLPGLWLEILNTDATIYGGSGMGNLGAVTATDTPAHGWPASALLTLPPLATLYFRIAQC